MTRQQRKSAPTTLQVSGSVDASTVEHNSDAQQDVAGAGTDAATTTPTLDLASQQGQGAGGTDPTAFPTPSFTPGAVPAVLWGNTCAEEIGAGWNKHGFVADHAYTIAVTFEDLVRWGAPSTCSLAGGLTPDPLPVQHAQDLVHGSTPEVNGAGTGAFDLHFSEPGSMPVTLTVANNGALALMRVAAAAYVLAEKHGIAQAILTRQAGGWDARPDLDVRCVLTMGGSTEDADSRNCGYVKGVSTDDFTSRAGRSAHAIAAHVAKAIDGQLAPAGHELLGNNVHADFPNQVPDQVLLGKPGATDPHPRTQPVATPLDAIAVSLDLELGAIWRHSPPGSVTYLTGAPSLQGEFVAGIGRVVADKKASYKYTDYTSWGGKGAYAEIVKLLGLLETGLPGLADASYLDRGGKEYADAFGAQIGAAIKAAFRTAGTMASGAWADVKRDEPEHRQATITTDPVETEGETRNAVGEVSYPE